MRSIAPTLVMCVLGIQGALSPAGERPVEGNVRAHASIADSAEAGTTCCMSHPTPGCDDPTIQACVCAIDPFCCNTAWDTKCVNWIGILGCGTCAPTEACCTAETIPGCSDGFIETCVCELDPFCCSDEWDGKCVNEVAQFGCGTCGGGSLVHDNCVNSIDIGTEGTRLFTSANATTDGPALPPSCNQGTGLAFVNDVWYCYTPPCGGQVLVSTCLSAFDTRLAVYDGCQCPATNASLLSCNDNSCGAQSSVSFNSTAGHGYLIRVGGISGTGQGLLSINGGGTPNTDDCNGNGSLDGCDLQHGTSSDCDVNHVPDECDIAQGRTVLQQLPDHSNGLIADTDCGAQCPTGRQSLAEQFVITQPRKIEKIKIWGGYAPSNNAGTGDNFTVVIHEGFTNVPGVVISTQNNVPSTRVQTGAMILALNEWRYILTLANPVQLSPGAYFIQIFNNTAGNANRFFWETAPRAAVGGLAGHAFALETPGTDWTFDDGLDLAIQIYATHAFDCDGDHVPNECDITSGAPAGDIDIDCDIDLTDYFLFTICVTGPTGGPILPGCGTVDFNHDDHVDLRDWGRFQDVFGTP